MSGQKRMACILLEEKLKGKRPLGRPRSRWVDNSKMDHAEIDGAVWTRFAWLMLVNSGGLL
jgi:hypothetical protein